VCGGVPPSLGGEVPGRPRRAADIQRRYPAVSILYLTRSGGVILPYTGRITMTGTRAAEIQRRLKFKLSEVSILPWIFTKRAAGRLRAGYPGAALAGPEATNPRYIVVSMRAIPVLPSIHLQQVR
jgi:hypothetical protein